MAGLASQPSMVWRPKLIDAAKRGGYCRVNYECASGTGMGRYRL